MNAQWQKRKQRIFEIIEVGTTFDYPSRIYDAFNALSILINLTVSILYTFEGVRAQHGALLLVIEEITVAFFAVDYALRLLTSKCLYPDHSTGKALLKYIFSFTGIIDMLSFLPYYLPIFFPAGSVAFRMLRIVRIFRLFRINAYYDSLSVITEVLRGKKQQLISSVFIIVVLMIASSLCMYSLEHEAQPDVFTSAFSGVWWAASTLLTVGYGDIYPITTLGKLLGIFITFLGVGMVAIPTGIISAGFVDQYSSIKRRSEYGYEAAVHFIKIHIRNTDAWAGLRIMELKLPTGVIIAAIKRKGNVIIPRGDVVLQVGDTVVLGAESFDDHENIKLKEVVLQKRNPWNGMRIRDLDISRRTVIVSVKRSGRTLIPNGNFVLLEGDTVFLFTQQHVADASDVEI